MPLDTLYLSNTASNYKCLNTKREIIDFYLIKVLYNWATEQNATKQRKVVGLQAGLQIKALWKANGVVCVVYVHVQVHPWVCNPRKSLGRLSDVFFYSCPPYWRKTGCPTEQKFTILTSLAGKPTLRIYPSPSHQCWDYRCMQLYLASHLGAEASNSGPLMFAQQALLSMKSYFYTKPSTSKN